MNRKVLIVRLLIVLTMLFNACDLAEQNLSSNSADLIIQSGFICGWGAGEDSIKISSNELRYVYYSPRISSKPQILKTRSVTAGEWNEIVNSFKIDQFEKLNYNTCNVCFDGCDEWIFIQNGQSSHKIRFGKGMKIDTISQLQLKLSALRTEFNP